jgi:hypothetical protein
MLLRIGAEASQLNYLVIGLIGPIPYHIFGFFGFEPGGNRVLYLGHEFYSARLYLLKLYYVPSETG